MEYKVGQSVFGTVSGITDYGVFVQLEDGGTGMIHISKLSNSFVSDIRAFIKRGESVTATVISNDNGKIALSLIEDARLNKKQDFESMLSSFKSASDEKLSTLNRDRKRRK
ncbi:MAG: S1 RNA-binding domain-containing protein [Clostridia bacterium]|nr:S1 RNA-binding domain-containing protein [Clostridia bacterium]